MSKRICYIFASRERPEKFFRCLENIQDMSESKKYFIIAKLDIDDPTAERYIERLAEFPEVIVRWGLSSGKIHAINRDLENLPPFDIICNHSDDFMAIEYGFDDVIREHCGDDDYLHVPDGFANERLSTYTIKGEGYFNRFGYIYSPFYTSVYADNEQFEVAKKLGRYKYVNRNILRHEHPINGFGVADDLLRRTEDKFVYAADHQTYLLRKANNFDL